MPAAQRGLDATKGTQTATSDCAKLSVRCSNLCLIPIFSQKTDIYLPGSDCFVWWESCKFVAECHWCLRGHHTLGCITLLHLASQPWTFRDEQPCLSHLHFGVNTHSHVSCLTLPNHCNSIIIIIISRGGTVHQVAWCTSRSHVHHVPPLLSPIRGPSRLPRRPT